MPDLKQHVLLNDVILDDPIVDQSVLSNRLDCVQSVAIRKLREVNTPKCTLTDFFADFKALEGDLFVV